MPILHFYLSFWNSVFDAIGGKKWGKQSKKENMKSRWIMRCDLNTILFKNTMLILPRKQAKRNYTEAEPKASYKPMMF